MPIGIFEQGSRSEPLSCLFRGDICDFSSQVSPLFSLFSKKSLLKKYVLKGKEKMASSRSPPHKIIFVLEKYDATAATIISACTGRTKHILDRREKRICNCCYDQVLRWNRRTYIADQPWYTLNLFLR